MIRSSLDRVENSTFSFLENQINFGIDLFSWGGLFAITDHVISSRL